jgi:FkbM family methyltransferase
MKIRRLLNKSVACLHILEANALPSFSQVGEDMIVNFLFKSLEIPNPSYLDIGVNHPVNGNNTYFFYQRGSRGVCIEPDPILFGLIKQKRKHDTIINCGIGLNEQELAPFYIFPGKYSAWNTFSQDEAKIRENESGITIKEIKVPLRSINQIIAENFKSYPNYISIDVEGLDLEILESFDFEKFKTEVFCVETIVFSTSNKGGKINDIGEFMKSKGYFVYADTYVNTIFCRNELFKTVAS